MSESLKKLADRVGGDPFFLAPVLRSYAEANALEDDALAGRLGCDAGALTGLRLCRNPDPQPPGFWKDVEAIAARFGLDAERLGEVVREGQAFLRLRGAAGGASATRGGFLMAARDREEGGDGGEEE